MSNVAGSELRNPLVEHDRNSFEDKGSNNVMGNIKISENGPGEPDTEPKSKMPDSDPLDFNNNDVSRSPVNLSLPFSRSCSPVEQQNQESFRSPINDSRGYYASALRRRERGSSSPPPPQRRRVAPRIDNTSQPYLPESPHDDPFTRANRVSPRPQFVRAESGVEVDELSPEHPASREASCEGFRSGLHLGATVRHGGLTFERHNSRERTQHAHPDPYVGVDASMEPFDDDDSDEYNFGGHEAYPFPSRLAQDSYRHSPGPSGSDLGYFVERDENGVSRRRQRKNSHTHEPVLQNQRRMTHRRATEYDQLFPPSKPGENPDMRRLSQFDARGRSGQSATDGEDETLFVPEYLANASNYNEQVGGSIENRGPRPYRQMFSHDTFIRDAPLRTPEPRAAGQKRKAVDILEDGGRFNQPGAGLDPSRYSGDPSVNWGLNQDPPSVAQTAVSDAALLKRGLTRGAKEKVCKRGYGANDPENVNIVNMKEDGMSFAEIVETLNETRVANGRAPSLSVCGVTSRYNRTAPLLFAAEGKQFIPLSKRGKGQVLADGPLYEKPIWNDQLDLVLAQVVKDVDKDKWARVAKEYNRRTGKNISAQSAALRHTIL